jgi:hypothetical protein
MLIENYNAADISLDFLKSNQWDLISLNKKVNKRELRNWYETVVINLRHLRFNFKENANLLKGYSFDNSYYTDKNKNIFDTTKAEIMLLNSYCITWPVQCNKPLPPKWAADLQQYPELIDETDFSTWQYMEQYMFGEFKKMYDDWGKDYWRNIRISEHMPGLILPVHTDKIPARLHIPMTEDNGKFYWGEKWDREYKLEVGNIYLINTNTFHSTSNLGPVPRANLLCDLQEEKLLSLLAL